MLAVNFTINVNSNNNRTNLQCYSVILIVRMLVCYKLFKSIKFILCCVFLDVVTEPKLGKNTFGNLLYWLYLIYHFAILLRVTL